jgi:hypothetical protein
MGHGSGLVIPHSNVCASLDDHYFGRRHQMMSFWYVKKPFEINPLPMPGIFTAPWRKNQDPYCQRKKLSYSLIWKSDARRAKR